MRRGVTALLGAALVGGCVEPFVEHAKARQSSQLGPAQDSDASDRPAEARDSHASAAAPEAGSVVNVEPNWDAAGPLPRSFTTEQRAAHAEYLFMADPPSPDGVSKAAAVEAEFAKRQARVRGATLAARCHTTVCRFDLVYDSEDAERRAVSEMVGGGRRSIGESVLPRSASTVIQATRTGPEQPLTGRIYWWTKGGLKHVPPEGQPASF